MRFSKNIIAGALAAAIGMAGLSQAHAAGELEHVTLSVYVNPAGAPQAFLKDNLLHPMGIEIDILFELQRRLMFNLKENRVYPLPRTDAFARLRDGTADLVIGGISYTEARAEKYDFTPVFWHSSLGILYSKDGGRAIRNENDIKGRRIGVEKDSAAEDYAAKYGATPVYFTNLTMAIYQLSTGQLDGLIYDRPPIADFASSVPSMNMAVTDSKFGEEVCMFAFALAKHSPYTKYISDTLKEMQEDGTIDGILAEWGAE